MGYKIGNDNGRIEGCFDTLTTDEVVGKIDYDKKDYNGGTYGVVSNVTETTGKEG